MRLLKIFTWLLFIPLTACGKENEAIPTEDTKLFEFTRGVHFNQWFESTSVNTVNFYAYSKQDFVNVKKLGCDVVRLPLNLQAMTNGKPDYKIDTKFFEMLDKVVSMAEEVEINLILDNHTFFPDESVFLSIEPMLLSMWDQMSKRYNNRSQFVHYQICNEPRGVTDQQWGEIQKNVIACIRKNDSKHTIIVSPTNWGSYNNLNGLPRFEDSNLMYDFHFYDPMLFTHQSAFFINPANSIANLPFPYDATRMPAFPADMNGTWFKNDYNNYAQIGNVAYLEKLLKIAADFKKERKVKLFCGELGVHIPGTPNADRLRWYNAVCSFLKKNDIPYILWDYRDVFGVFKYDPNMPGKHYFPDDLNLELLDVIDFKRP